MCICLLWCFGAAGAHLDIEQIAQEISSDAVYHHASVLLEYR